MAGVVRWVRPDRIDEVLRACKDAEAVGLDTETTALTSRKGKLRLIQLSVPGMNYILDAWKYDPQMLAPLFDGETKFVGHNLAFDLSFLKSVGLEVPHGKNLFDTMIASQLLVAGIMPRLSNSLQQVVLRNLGKDISKEQQTSDWSKPVLDLEQVKYAAEDAAILLPLYEKLAFQIQEAKVQRVFDIEMRCLPAMVWLQDSGIPVDAEMWSRVADKYVQEVENLEAALAELTDTRDILGWSRINWRSPAQVLEIFKARGRKIEDTTDDTLADLAARGDELAELLLTYRERVKRRDTYGHKWVEQFVHTDGRVYPEYRQIGAFSGRMSCTNPNIQQIPRKAEFRECFRPTEGRRFVIADYSQIELRIAVEMTMDPVGFKAYAVDHTDLHKATATLILGSNDKDARQVAKSLNFGLIYGAGSETLRLYAQSAFGVKMSPEDAKAKRDQWRRTYTGIVRWHRSIQEGVEATRTLAGRRRLNVDKFTEKLNTPVQGTGADGMKAAMALCYERRDELPEGAFPVAVVHDELVFECQEQHVTEVGEWLRRNMIQGMACFVRKVPVDVEYADAGSWADK